MGRYDLWFALALELQFHAAFVGPGSPSATRWEMTIPPRRREAVSTTSPTAVRSYSARALANVPDECLADFNPNANVDEQH